MLRVDQVKNSCKYPTCLNKQFKRAESNFKHFFSFPKNEEIQLAWKRFCGISPTINVSNFKLCEDHFNENDFYNSLHKRLLKTSIPTKPTDTPQACSSAQESVDYENCSDFHLLDDTTCDSNDSAADLMDHTYCKSEEPNFVENSNFDFLTSESPNVKGLLRTVGISKKDLTPRKTKMYEIHRKSVSKISKLKNRLNQEKDKVRTLKKLYQEGKFQLMENELNFVTKEFINSQMRNVNRSITGRRWTIQDKSFALAMFKRSPRVYRYLANYFFLPSPRTLKGMLSKIPFETGINALLMDCLAHQVEKMNPLDRYCVLMFDEMKVDMGLHYEHHKGYISGFVDLGHLGRQSKFADHALVFMARGIRKSWKQVIAYYFSSKTIATIPLKVLIKEIISNLQKIGLSVVATVCDQGPTNRAALRKLMEEDTLSPDDNYTFSVNRETIAIIFDVPHLLKNTRNALLRCDYTYDGRSKKAQYKYIEGAFTMDQSKRTFKMLPRLKPEYFNFKDSWVKMKVKVAARQMSYSVAAAIETWVASGSLPSEAVQTAEFVHKIDSLFDSLNGYSFKTSGGKPLRSVLKDDTPHVEFWSKTLEELKEWQLIEKSTGKNVTKEYEFINGWITTIRSIRFLWNRLRNIGFNYFNMRSFNQDPLENLFSIIRQHGIANTNPTCHQFVAALKTTVVNNLSTPVINGNCEDDDCRNLNNLSIFLESNSGIFCSQKPSTSASPEVAETSGGDEDIGNDCELSLDYNSEESYCELDFMKELLKNNATNYATSYVAGYILKKIHVPDCENCSMDLFSKEPNENHLFITFKEFSDVSVLNYPSDKMINFVEAIDILMQKFLEENGHIIGLEERLERSI